MQYTIELRVACRCIPGKAELGGCLLQARKSSEQLLAAQRTERLADLSGGMTGDFVTSRPSGMTVDEADGLQRLNIILKVSPAQDLPMCSVDQDHRVGMGSGTRP